MGEAEEQLCLNHCGRAGVIYLCGEGFCCEPCFRSLGNVPAEIASARMRKGVNDGTMSTYLDAAHKRLKASSEELDPAYD